MKQLRIIVLLVASLFVVMTQAEILVLHSGQQVQGEIVLQNDDIIMIRDAEGRRFQYPRTEVEQIILSLPSSESKEVIEVQQDNKSNCALRLDLSGGALFVPGFCNGGYGSAAIQIGTRHIGKRSIFLGGSVGYQAAVGKELYNFLPLMAVVSFPFFQGQHAPEFGAALGYGFALKNPSQGGLVAKIDLSWRYQYTHTSALLLGVQTSFQQAQVKDTEVIEEKTYTSCLGKNFVGVGLRLAFQF